MGRHARRSSGPSARWSGTAPMRLSELSEQLRIAPRSTTEVVDALQEHGLVRREPDPHDRRATLVRLTDRGTEVATAIRATRDAGARLLRPALGPGPGRTDPNPAHPAHLTQPSEPHRRIQCGLLRIETRTMAPTRQPGWMTVIPVGLL